jgi:hypothetical protein
MSSIAVLEFLVLLEVRTCLVGCVSIEVVLYQYKIFLISGHIRDV